ncbi:DUF6087 family protein [Kitasatospora sp. NPDC004745]|uniref:DUF6087 family protein n=1 Tax=unclassified Kitasatospora TaxID=2633591 RepID=UPI0033C221CC
MDEEEPLAQWAARREQRRRPVGQLRAVGLGVTEGDGGHGGTRDGIHDSSRGGGDAGRGRGAHVAPAQPRLIVRWDGYQWLPEAVAEDYAAAQRILHGIEGDGVVRSAWPAQPRRAPGRHRKP